MPVSQSIEVKLLGCSRDRLLLRQMIQQVRAKHQSPTAVRHLLNDGRIDRDAVERQIGSGQSADPVDAFPFLRFVFSASHISEKAGTRLSLEYPQEIIGNAQPSGHFVPDAQWVTPPAFKNDPDIEKQWRLLQEQYASFIGCCRKSGIQGDDLCYAAPGAAPTSLLLIFDFRSLQQFLDKELCENMPWETSRIAWKIYAIMKSDFPVLARKLGISCWENRQMFCREPVEVYQRCRFGQGQRPHREMLDSLFSSQVNEPALVNPE